MGIILKIKIEKNKSIATILKEEGFTDGYIYSLVGEGKILFDGKKITSKNQLINGEEIEVALLDEEIGVIPTMGKLDIIYEDEYLMILNKPSGVIIEPSKGDNINSLANYVAYYYMENGIKSGVHIVNRLDRETSGLTIFAKNGYIHNLLTKTKIEKKYMARVYGKIENGEIKVRIKKSNNGIKREVSKEGKECITRYEKICDDGNNSVLRITLLTGRTHQIRVSFDYIGHPLLGDKLYGDKGGEYFLMSSFLSFVHPISKKIITINLENNNKMTF